MNENNNLIDIHENPLDLFTKWFEEANSKEINDPNAMNLSTVNDDLQPSSRMVLLKSYNKEGFIFYTNLNSKKGTSIKKNNKVALNFHWKSLRKQIRIQGCAEKINNEDADKYFKSRPADSKIGAWASNQSSELTDRKDFEKEIVKYKNKFGDIDIPRPEFWTGFKVKPNLIEFWKEMPFRLHDRVEYFIKGNKWFHRRLYP